MSITKTVVSGSDNAIELTLTQTTAGVETPYNLAGIYSLELELLGSAIAATVYTVLTAGNILDTSTAAGATGILLMRLGLIVGLPVGTFHLRLKAKTSNVDVNPTSLVLEDTENEVIITVLPSTAAVLIVEDGTGLPDSASYASVAFADAYHLARRNQAWSTAPVLERVSALIRASDYIDQRWGRRFLGRRLLGTQALQWPRYGLVDEFRAEIAGVPLAIQRASAEYALRALAAPLSPDPVLNANGKVTRLLERVEGAVTSEVQYAEGYAAPTIYPYPLADALVRPYVSESSELLRA